MVLGFWDLMVPIVGAPMAGGPGTPALAAAVSNAGGLGFVAGGYLSAEQFADDIVAARAATTGPIGVNLLVPQPSVADFAQLDYYAEELEEVAEHYHVEVGHPDSDYDDEWQRKLEVVADIRPEMVSFTFGAPSPDIVRRFSALGMLGVGHGDVGLRGRGGDRRRRGQPGGPGAECRRSPRHLRSGHGARHRVADRASRSDRQRPSRCPAHRGGRSGHRRGCRRRAAQGSGGRAGRHRPAAGRRSRHQLHAPRRPEASGVHRLPCHPGVLGPLRAWPGELLHAPLRPRCAAWGIRRSTR